MKKIAQTPAQQTGRFGLPILPNEKVPAEKPQPTAPASQSGQAVPASNGSAFAAVKEMQNAILEFANAASASDVTSMQGDKAGRQTTPSGEYLGASDPFGNFLAQHLPGTQYTNTDVTEPDRDRMGIQDTNLRGMIDSIKRIGTPGLGEKRADGIWKQRTNHALQQIGTLMTTIRDLTKSMSVPLKNSFDTPQAFDKAVEDFMNNVPKQYTDIQEDKKAELAATLTAEIQEFTKVFSEFKSNVLNDPELKSYIDQTKSFKQYSKGPTNGRDTLTPDEQKIFTGAKTIPNLFMKNVSNTAMNYVFLEDLDNMANFSKFMQRIGRNAQDPQQVEATLAEVSKGLETNTTSVNDPASAVRT